MNQDRLKLPMSKPARVAASSHRAPSSSMPTEASKPPAVRGRKFSGLDPFTVSLIASAPVVSPAVRVVGRRVPVKPAVAPVALEVAPPAEIVESKPAGPNRLMLGLGAALAVGLAGFAGLKARSA
jgi:hypothetical protein